MRRLIQRSLFTGAVLAIAAIAAVALAQAPFELPPVSDNAALQYWQAFALLPALDAEQEKLLDNRATVPLDDAVLKLLDQSRTSFKFMHRGAKLRQCDWGLDYDDGVSMHLPHLAKARTLCRLAALDIRRAFEANQHDVASDDAAGMMTLARRVGNDFTLVSMLVDIAIEDMVVDSMAPHLPELKASYDKSVKLFESLPPFPSLDHAVACEKQMATTIITQLKDAEQQRPGSWREMLRQMIGPDNPELFKDADSLDEVVQQMEKFLATYDELAKLVSLPRAEFDAKFPAFVARARAASPVADLSLPAMDKVLAARNRHEARLALLLAAIAVVESGPEKLADIKDPFGDGPFAYRKLKTGFELSSKLTENGKPVTLKIGQKIVDAK